MNKSFRRNMLASIFSICGLIAFVYIFVPRAPLDGRSAFSSLVMPNSGTYPVVVPDPGRVLSLRDRITSGARYGSNGSDALTMLSNDLQRIALPVFIIVGGLCLALAIFAYSRRRL